MYNNNEVFSRYDDETQKEYIDRICKYKVSNQYGLTWKDVANIININISTCYDESTFRKKYKQMQYNNIEIDTSEDDTSENNTIIVDNFSDEFTNKFLELRKERIKLSDTKTQLNTVLRRLAREETIKEIACDLVEHTNKFYSLPKYQKIKSDNEKRSAILEISDWHYGIEINSAFNTYNPEIARKRVIKLKDEVITWLDHNKDITTLNVFNLGDLIAGRIHQTIRLFNVKDTLSQIMEVSEIFAQFLSQISEKVNINYFDTSDNHSRIEPIKENSLDAESLYRITTWYLKEVFKDNPRISINNNVFGDDIVETLILNHKVGAVHGDKDKPEKVVENLTLLTKQPYNLICTAHLHHFNCDEKNECIVVSNSSLMGTDQYAEHNRFSATPAQNLIVLTENNPCREIIRFELN